jgi:hypothetical protein
MHLEEIEAAGKLVGRVRFILTGVPRAGRFGGGRVGNYILDLACGL